MTDTPTTEAGALHLLARVREALADNGRMMQDELLDHCRELADLPARVAELEATHGTRTDAADPNGTTCARLKWWKDRDDAAQDRIAELQAEIEKLKPYKIREEARERINNEVFSKMLGNQHL